MVNGALSAVLWLFGVLHFVFIASLVGSLLMILPARLVFPIARMLCRSQLRVMGCRLEVKGLEGLPADQAFLFLGNHQSLFDIFAVGAALPTYAIGLEAASHFRYPVWGWVTRAWGNLPLAEGRVSVARETLRHAGRLLRDGTNVIVLPEGHRTRTGELRDLRKGAFHLALATEADIVPFILDGLYEFKNVHSWRLRPQTLRVVYGKVIPWETCKEDSIDQLRGRIREALEQLKAGLGTLAG
ncbi:MAG: 1-acyl-sn-glycerol-3-phosphate acyltransferase [Thermoanaerobaculales bacterium]|nr:1-acyl-sn-glycerol-3-phosphate acyltransferase [Thermoanaerobaculales bacterium]